MGAIGHENWNEPGPLKPERKPPVGWFLRLIPSLLSTNLLCGRIKHCDWSTVERLCSVRLYLSLTVPFQKSSQTLPQDHQAQTQHKFMSAHSQTPGAFGLFLRSKVVAAWRAARRRASPHGNQLMGEGVVTLLFLGPESKSHPW